ncbi:hypothetical protein ACFPC0_10815 [Streptomyces andamanensis]|uniref:Uncharacterized protein n=1 Tax=Streptomyces andamanensis TaxID=1565035 RepID=A0ABV8TCH5_9ACTN
MSSDPAARPPARPAGLYATRPALVRAIQFTGTNLPEVSSFFGRDLDSVDLPGVGPSIPLATHIGTLYASPGDMLVEDEDGELSPHRYDQFDRRHTFQEAQPA